MATGTGLRADAAPAVAPEVKSAGSAVVPPVPPPPPKPTSDALRTIFVYGPLMAEEAIKALLGRVPSMRHATLPGYVRCCKRGADTAQGICSTHRSLVRAGYPAAVRSGSSCDVLEGVLLERLRSAELQILDYYEDGSYSREMVEVVAADGFGTEEAVSCFAYVWPVKQIEHLDLRSPWQYTIFRAQHMKSFVEQVILPCRKGFEKEVGALETIMTARESARSQRSARSAAPTAS